MSILGGFALAKWATPRVPSLKRGNYHLHHWMWASIVLIMFIFIEVSDIIIGVFTGVALQGLTYKNWSLTRKSDYND